MVKLWDAATGKEVKNLQDHIDAVFAVAFSPDGKHLASGSQDRSVKIWDIATGQRLYTLSDATDGLTSIAYSPPENRLPPPATTRPFTSGKWVTPTAACCIP